jgi:hypothetical protein
MSDQFVDAAKERMGAIERLLKGLPGINGYVDKELRRDADKQTRMLLAQQLELEKQDLLAVQRTLLNSGGLMWLDDVDQAVTKLQTLADRIKTASYGYAGLFDAVRIREEQLNALNKFDQAMGARTVDIRMAIDNLGKAANGSGDIGDATRKLTALLADLNNLYSKRYEAMLSPQLLDTPGYMDDVQAPDAPQLPAQPSQPAQADQPPSSGTQATTQPPQQS